MSRSLPKRLVEKGVSLLIGAVLVGLSARLAVALPGGSVPHTLQTLAVLLVGLVLGCRQGSLSLLLYLALGACGLPLFAAGASGLSVLLGPTGGFLLGFVPAAALVGYWRETGALGGLLGACWRMLIAHGLILICGLLRLTADLGLEQAYAAGVAPFLLGAVVKSGLAAVAAVVLNLRTAGTHPETVDWS